MSLIFLFTIPVASYSATFDPSFKFMTLETEHFRVYYHQGLEQIGSRAAVTAEEVHKKLSALLQWDPEEKTNIVLADNSDFANGMTTVIPYNIIYLQTAPPPLTSSIGEYDNWLRLLIIHEYAHVLTSDPVRGYRKVMRKIFGKVVPLNDLLDYLVFAFAGPSNMLMPRWWHEGMATWAETELTSSGRGRNSYYQMLYRTAVAENKLLSIDKINGDIPYWPEGNSPYIFGSKLIQYIAEKYGADLPGSISRQQSGRAPYFINGTAEDLFNGKNYSELYNDMLSGLNRTEKEKITALNKEPFTSTRKVGKPAVMETNPRFSPDGMMLAFNRDDRHSHPSIVIQDSTGKEIANFWRKYGDGAISWSPDNSSIVFSQAEYSNDGNFYQDIFRYDLKSSTLKRLTRGLRAAAPDISPDGKKLVAVINSRGGQNLALLDLEALLLNKDDVSPKSITSYAEYSISSPRWSPDGKSIAFAYKDSNGSPSLSLLNVDTSTVRELYSSAQTVDSPVWSQDGSRIFFTSDENGVFNIHYYELSSEEKKQVTHLLSGAFSPDINSSDGTMAVSEYTSNGFTVSLITKENLRNSLESAPAISSIVYPVRSSMLEPLEQPAPLSIRKESPYSPIESLIPRFWLPSMIAETSIDSAVGAVTAGQDVLGYHTVYGKALYGSIFNKAYFEALYEYGRFTPSFTLQGYALPATYTNLIPSQEYNEIERGAVATMKVPIGSLDSPLHFNAGYHLRDQKALSNPTANSFNGNPVFQGRRDSFFAGFDYYDRYRYPWSVSREQGRTLTFNFEYFGKETGSMIETKEYKASWSEYFSLWNNHNIMAQLSGALADGDQTPQGSFQLGGITSFYNPFGLRGYESRFFSGSRIATGTLEYRFPVEYFLKGFGTSPFFMDRLHGAIFLDAGETWDANSSFKGRDIMFGAGTEIRFDMTLGYWLKLTPAIGYAHGFDKDFGSDQIYFMVYANL